MTSDDAKILLNTEPDWIYSKRFSYSLAKLVGRYPDGAPDRVIAQVLLMTEEDVQAMYDRIVGQLRTNMGITV